MGRSIKKLGMKIRELAERYPVVLAAIVIYLFADVLIFNVFRHSGESRPLLDYVVEFGSIFFLFLAAAAFIQLQRLRKEHKEEEQRTHRMERVLDRQQIYTQLVNDITLLLQDNVNNPLAVIAVTTQEIRRRFEKDTEILRWLDRIDGAMQRIHHTIRDIQAYEAQKLMDSSKEMMQRENGKP